MNNSFLAKTSLQISRCTRLLPVPCLDLFKGQEGRGKCSWSELVFVAFVRFSQGVSTSGQVQWSFVRLINQKVLYHRGLGCSRTPTCGWGNRNKSRLHAGREAGGEECDESRPEKFSSTVLIGSIFRLQYLAGPIMQFIFPQEDTNDLANLFLWS